MASATPPLIKLPQSQWQQRLQDFKNWIKRSVGIESIQDAPPRGTESMQSVSPYNTESQQILYLEETLTRELKEKWKGFNSWIKAWQNQWGYPKFKTVYSKKLEKNLKILKDLLKAKWLKEIEEDLILKEL